MSRSKIDMSRELLNNLGTYSNTGMTAAASVWAQLAIAEGLNALAQQQRVSNMIAAKTAGISPQQFGDFEKIAGAGASFPGGGEQ